MESKRDKILSWLLAVAMLMILVAAALPILKVQWEGSRYVFAAGAAVAMLVRIFTKPKSTTSLRVKRLHRMENVSALLYCVAAFFLFYPDAQPTDWLGFLTAGAVLQIYASFTIDYIEKKERNKNNN